MAVTPRLEEALAKIKQEGRRGKGTYTDGAACGRIIRALDDAKAAFAECERSGSGKLGSK